MIKGIGLLINVLSLFSLTKARDIAYKLFSTPRTGKIKKNQVPLFLSQSKRSSFVFNDLEIQCYQWNSERTDLPLVMLFHGWESNANRWEQMIDYLGDGYQYICVDSMGLGLSDGKNLSVIDYSRLIDYCLSTYQPNYVVSHSLSSFALLYQLAQRSYPFIEKVVLMGCLDRFQVVIDNYVGMLGYRTTLVKSLNAFLESLIHMSLSDYVSNQFIQKASNDVLIIHDRSDVVVELKECMTFHNIAKEKGIEVFYTDDLGHSMQDPIVFQKVLNYFKEK